MIFACLAVGLLLGSRQAPAADNPIADIIRQEALMPNHGEAGRPLPLYGSWKSDDPHHALTPAHGILPADQINLIRQGHHVIPWFPMPPAALPPAILKLYLDYVEGPIKEAAQLHLPIAFMGTQWEQVLYDPAFKFSKLRGFQNPNVVDAHGKLLPGQLCLSPFGPVSVWEAAGKVWTSTEFFAQVQQWYPNPPLVLFFSNNEAFKLSWKNIYLDGRFNPSHGVTIDGAYRREVMSKGWIERYRALLRGVRSGLTNPTWQANSKFMGYNAFGSWVMGDISNWEDHALDYAGHIDPGPEMWDGGAPSYYAAINAGLTDYQVRSPQIGAMNYIFMQDQAASYNPQFWFNLSVWDGHVPRSPKDSWATYSSQGQTFTPTRYSGFVQFGLWLTQPRLILDYRNYPDSYDEVSPYMQQVMAAVDRIYGSAELQAFWRKGELVPNPERPNPFNLSIPPEYQGVNRWFLLSTNLDPPDPWKLQNTEILAYAIARVIGTAPQRRWLVYAFSPLGDRPGVKIKIPGYAPGMEIPVTQGGSFYSVSESSGVVSVVR